MKPPFVAIVGPTASGKSGMGMALAHDLGGEIVSCDSVQVYRGFDIGAAKPTLDEQRAVRHHLIDVCGWRDEFDAKSFARAARAAIVDIASRGKIPFVIGGTGLYFRALCGASFHDSLPKDAALRKTLDERPLSELYIELQSKDPERAAELHANDRVRVTRALEIILLTGRKVSEVYKTAEESNDQWTPALTVLLEPPKPVLWGRIEARTQAMLNQGLIDEVVDLLNYGCSADAKPMQSIGYREVIMMLRGLISRDVLPEQIVIATRQYSKKQLTWFHKTPVDHTVTTEEEAETLSQVLKKQLAKGIGELQREC